MKSLNVITELIGLVRIPEKKVSFSVSFTDKLLAEITNLWNVYQDENKRKTLFWSSNWKCCTVQVKNCRGCCCFFFNSVAAHCSGFHPHLGHVFVLYEINLSCTESVQGHSVLRWRRWLGPAWGPVGCNIYHRPSRKHLGLVLDLHSMVDYITANC